MMNSEMLHVVCDNKDSWIVEEDKFEENKWYVDDHAVEIDRKARRKSWHAIKFERKRKKGVVENSSPPETRQKRLSWWNIFANQQWPRSRRASQDVSTVTKNSDVFPWTRSKSRSVDHGITSPFDLEALRSKVDSQLDKNIDKDSNSITEKRKIGPPKNTTTYTVGDRDTLTSVAARFDTTPSELTKLNRLGTPFIFPGQQLFVPIRVPDNDSEESTPIEEIHDDLPTEEKELLDNLRPVSPKPGHAERIRTPSGPSESIAEEESAIYKRFLKINVRHITDGQGVVSGVLLVTPNAVMFDPNVSDPLVIEHGPEAYGVIAPMEFVVNAAIYTDIAHMRVGHTDNISAEKPEIYYPKSEKHDSLMVKDETFPELVTGDDAESICSCTDREGDAFPKAFERDLVTPTNLDDPDHLHSQRSAEERRKSLLDHHWAIPSRDRAESLSRSVDNDDMPMSTSPALLPEEQEPDECLLKQSCHDSGIDITDTSIPPILPSTTKKVYSDADIVLSREWVPPVTIASTHTTNDTDSPGRKKTSSVSFSLDSSSEADPSTGSLSTSVTDSKDETDKGESRKNKMLKRLSYPLSWMETFAGDGSKEEVEKPVHPHSADAHHSSMFSKVFSSSPINLVDFGTGLFLSKTPSEESGGSGGPHSGGSGGPPLTPATGLSESPHTDSSSFFPTNIISSMGASVGAMGAQVGAMGAQMGATVGATVGAVGEAVGASVNAVGGAVNAVGATVGAVGRSSVGTFIRQPGDGSGKHHKAPPPKLDYRSMVSVEDMPELFVSFEKLIPRPARSCDDPPLYLRLRMGKPMNKPIPRSTPLMSYGKKKMRPEYWFSVPKNKVDELYNFVLAWVPQLYGELNEESVHARGYSLVELNTELWSEEPTPSASRHGSQDGEMTELTKESWELIKAPYVKIYSIIKTQTMSADGNDEVLPMSEDLRRALYESSAPSLDVELTPPDLIGTTEVLTYEHRENLCKHLPARAEGYVWTLVFSTSQHGFSLNSMYRKMQKLETPILLVIQDTDNNVFGALTSCALQVSDHFYGTGESLLFRFSPEFQAYNWTGENLYFIKGNNESLSIGAGDGKFGLWLDGDLYQGRSESCKTYGNEPLTPNSDFVVKTLECWAFV